LLLDISLPDDSGFDILAKFPDRSLKVIFLTAYQEHAIKAIKYGALDYLLKPIVEDEFKVAINKALPITKDQFDLAHNGFKNGVHNRLVLRSQNYIQIVAVNDIIYCKSDSGYTNFFLADGRNVLTSKYIKEYEEVLPAKKFIRPHQSYIVNLDFIDRYHKEGYLLLKNNIKIPVSVRRKEDVTDYLKGIH
jgi:two-component system LytT family response regulator